MDLEGLMFSFLRHLMMVADIIYKVSQMRILNFFLNFDTYNNFLFKFEKIKANLSCKRIFNFSNGT